MLNEKNSAFLIAKNFDEAQIERVKSLYCWMARNKDMTKKATMIRARLDAQRAAGIEVQDFVVLATETWPIPARITAGKHWTVAESNAYWRAWAMRNMVIDTAVALEAESFISPQFRRAQFERLIHTWKTVIGVMPDRKAAWAIIAKQKWEARHV